jgi:lysophospholipase L1-like esterase
MKKIILLITLFYYTVSPVLSVITPNPIISRGKPVFTSSGNAAYLVDNKFNAGTWSVTANSWIAIQVGSGPSKVFVNWNNPVYAWSNELSPSKCLNANSFPIDYDLLTSSNSTNGVDGLWTIVDSIRGNLVTARGHLIDFTGSSWVKIKFLKVGGNPSNLSSGGSIDEVEVFNASNSTEDTWFYAGTSISANAFKATPPAKDVADIVNTSHAAFNPVMIRGGIGCITSTDFVNNISKYLKMAGNVHFWAIEMGTNDAWGGTNGNVSTFKTNMQKVIDSCKSYGIQPIIAHVLATNPARTTLPTGWQIHSDYFKAVDELAIANNLIPGPDLFTWFLAHPEELNSDGVHPNATGAASIQRLWAQKMDSLYGGCSYVQIVPYIKVNRDSAKLIASTILNQYDTLLLSPRVNISGSWSWTGPNGFSATSREINVNNIQVNQAGSYIATLTFNDSCIFSYTFKIKVRSLVAIKSIESSSEDITIYPNPAIDGRFKISVNNLSGAAHVQIYNVLGKLSYSAELMKNETDINTALPKGIYIVKVSIGKHCLNQKLVIK